MNGGAEWALAGRTRWAASRVGVTTHKVGDFDRS